MTYWLLIGRPGPDLWLSQVGSVLYSTSVHCTVQVYSVQWYLAQSGGFSVVRSLNLFRILFIPLRAGTEGTQRLLIGQRVLTVASDWLIVATLSSLRFQVETNVLMFYEAITTRHETHESRVQISTRASHRRNIPSIAVESSSSWRAQCLLSFHLSIFSNLAGRQGRGRRPGRGRGHHRAGVEGVVEAEGYQLNPNQVFKIHKREDVKYSSTHRLSGPWYKWQYCWRRHRTASCRY